MDNRIKWLLGIFGVIIIGVIIGLSIKSHQNNSHDSQIQSNNSSSPSSVATNNSTTSPDSTNPSTSQNTTTPATTNTTATCYTASQATNEIGQTGCVQFTGYAYTSYSGQMYLDQSLSAPYGFSAYIPAGSSFGPSLLNQYSGQNIDVTGSIVNYNGEPEIEVTSASQIQSAN